MAHLHAIFAIIVQRVISFVRMSTDLSGSIVQGYIFCELAPLSPPDTSETLDLAEGGHGRKNDRPRFA